MRISRLLLVSLLMATLLQPVRAEEKPQILAVVEVESLAALLGDSLRLSQALRLPPMREQIESALAEALDIETTASIDNKSPLRAFIYAPSAAALKTGDEPDGVLEIPVGEDGDAFLAELEKAFSNRSVEGELITFSDRINNANCKENTLYVQRVGNAMFLGDSAAIVALAAADMQTARLNTTMPRIPGTIRVGINMPAVTELMTAAFAGMQADMAASPDAEAPMPAIKAEALQDILKQIQSVCYSLSARANTLEMYARFEPRTGTALGNWVNAMRPPSPAYSRNFAPNTAIAIAGGGMNGLEFMVGPYLEFLDSVYTSMGPEMAAVMPPMRDLMLTLTSLYEGDFMIALAPNASGKGAAFVQMLNFTDAPAALDVALKSMTSFNETFGKAMPGMGLKSYPERDHNAIKIYRYGYTIDPAAMQNNANAPMPTDPASLAFLNQFQWEMATKGSDLLYVFNMGDGTGMDEALDRLTTPGTDIRQLDPFASLFPEIKGEPVSLVSFGFMRTIKSILAMIPGVDPLMVSMLPDSKGGMAGYAVVHNGNLLGQLRLGYDEINLIRDSSSMIGAAFMQAMMKNMMQNAAGPTGSPEAMQAACVNNLRMLDAAKEQYALENSLAVGKSVTAAEISAYLLGGSLPLCPLNGEYTLGTIGENPTCSLPGHTLP